MSLLYLLLRSMSGYYGTATRDECEIFRQIVNNKPRRAVHGKVNFDWKKAEEGLLIQMQRSYKGQELQAMMRVVNTLLHLSEEKFIPDFYIFYKIATLLITKQTALMQLSQEYKNIENGQSEYHNISIQLTLQESLLTKMIQKQRIKEECIEVIQQLRQVHVVSIHRINEWENKISMLLGSPVFFYWNSIPYLLALGQIKAVDSQTSPLKSHIQIHEMFLNTRSKQGQDLESEVLRVIKQAKSRQLELILNLPAYANVKSQKTKQSKNTVSPQNLAYMKFQMNKNIKKQAKLENTSKKGRFDGLGAQELQVIKRFRSYKKLAIPQRKLSTDKNNTTQQSESFVDSKLRNKIGSLRQKVKENPNKTRDISIDNIKPTERTIRIILEQQVDISDKNNPDNTKFMIESIAKSSLTSSPGKKSQRAEDIKAKRIMKLENQMRKFAQNNQKRKQGVNVNGQNLSSIKLQLVEKIRKEHSPKRNIRRSPAVKKQIKKMVKDQDLIKNEVQKQKSLIEQQKKVMISAKEEASMVSRKVREQFTQYISQKQLNERRLRQKMQNVNRLKQKHQLESKLDKNDIEDSLSKQVSNLKVKKQMEYEYQKQKINELSVNLQERVKEEQVKYAELKLQEENKQRILKQRLQKQIQVVRRNMDKESQIINRQIEEEHKKQRQYEQKIARQKQQNEKMIQQLKLWQQKQKELLISLEQQKRKRDFKIQQQRLRRKVQIQTQLLQMQKKQMEVVNQYRSANRNLVSLLDGLKSKTFQLQQKLGTRI